MTTDVRLYDDQNKLNDMLRTQHRGEGAVPQIPNFEQLREIGRGGQGIVYIARQISTGKTRAIKVMHPKVLDSPGSHRRFEREIEIVSSLDHRGIVRILDRGKTADGRVYFVMEYIEGQPMNERMENDGPPQERAALRGVLRLFHSICQGLDYAHKREMVHRDLKPNNIRIDTEGEPRILDFGLAKNLAPGAESVTSTEGGGFQGALPWASPEQADGYPKGADIRTDIYSLGVILYQLVTGRFPYEVVGTPHDVIRNIREAEPRKPSKHNSIISNDLQTIILKALAKEPDRRYQTAGDLARDIQHYLDDEPIEAKRDDTIYILRKMVRRHRWPVAMTAAVSVLVMASSILGWDLYLDAEAARGKLEQQSYFEQIGLAGQSFEKSRLSTMRTWLDDCATRFRAWEWDHLDAISDTSLHTLTAHTGDLNQVVFSPDETLLASAAGDGTVCVWDAHTGHLLHGPLMADSESATCVAFGPDGKRLFAGTRHAGLLCWNTGTEERVPVDQFDAGPIHGLLYDASTSRLYVGFCSGHIGILDGHSGEVVTDRLRTDAYEVGQMGFLSDSDRLLYSSAKAWGLLNPVTGERLFSKGLSDDGTGIVFAAIAPSDGRIVGRSGCNTLGFYDPETFEIMGTWTSPQPETTSLACSSHDGWMATGGSDGTVCVRHVGGESPDWLLRGHDAQVDTVTFSSSGRLIASGGRDHTIRIWAHPIGGSDEAEGGVPLLAVPGHAITSDGVALSNDGRIVTLCWDLIRVWEPATGRLLAQRRCKNGKCVAFSPDETKIAVATGESSSGQPLASGRIELLDALTLDRLESTESFAQFPLGLCFHPSGTEVAVVLSEPDPPHENSSWIGVWAVDSDQALRRLNTCPEAGRGIRYAPSGDRLMFAGFDGLVREYDLANGRQVQSFKAHKGLIHACAYSADGHLVATVGQDAYCRIWDAETGEQLHELKRHNGAVFSVAFSHDNRRVVTGGRDKLVHVWDLEAERIVHTLRGHRGVVAHLSFSEGDEFILTADQSDLMALWPASPTCSEWLHSRYASAYSYELFERLFKESEFEPDWVDQMIASVRAMHPDDAELHKAFSEMARLLAENPHKLEKKSWGLVEEAGGQLADYERGMRAAERALECAPDDLVILQTLGVAQYRARRYIEALSTLEAVINQRRKPHDYAVLAMCLYQLGRETEAQQTLDTALEVSQTPEFEAAGEMHRFVKEASLLITSAEE